jgi:hypothetical protein
MRRMLDSDDSGYVDLIQDTKLGNTLEKLTYALRDTRDNFIFLQLKFVRNGGGFRLY